MGRRRARGRRAEDGPAEGLRGAGGFMLSMTSLGADVKRVEGYVEVECWYCD